MHKCDVLIVGGGIVGTSLLHVLANYTSANSVLMLEKNSGIAQENSNAKSNSQTLHVGDLESNYSLKKALEVKLATSVLINYAKNKKNKKDLIFKHPKMLLGVGETECDTLLQRYDTFGGWYPKMRKLDGNCAIGKQEPNVIIGRRREKLLALSTMCDYSTANFENIAKSFTADAMCSKTCDADVELNATVTHIEQQRYGYYVTYSLNGSLCKVYANKVVVCAGAKSLVYAKRMGYGKQVSCLPIAGSFFQIPKNLYGKVYTVQSPKLPFAAIHGDIDLNTDMYDRLGPTAALTPMLERGKLNTFFEFLKVFGGLNGGGKALANLLSDPTIRNYMIRNIGLNIPYLNKRLFLADAKKIIPSLKLSDLKVANGIGGIRPVLVNNATGDLKMGEAKLLEGSIMFNITPSPGASTSLFNAIADARYIANNTFSVFEDKIKSELY